MSNKEIAVKNKIDINIEEMETVENFISQVLIDDSFNNINNINIQTNNDVYSQPIFKLTNENETIEFISVNEEAFAPYSKIMTEKEFFKIVGAGKNGISSRSGRYQESLYYYYLDAKMEQDLGYITDVLNKAVVFKNNLNYVRMLTKNKDFMREWRKDFGKESPIKIFKNSGNLRLINIVNERR